MQRVKPSEGEIYHVYNRGIEKRKVFLDEEDHLRFIHDLFEFNDRAPAGKMYDKKQLAEVGSPHIGKREFIVEVLAFCLMPNHYHLLLRQITENGIPEFMQKIGTGYTGFFNKKYVRVGALFQGKYKLVHVKEEAHFVHLPYYIHLNPLDLITPEWRDDSIADIPKATSFLERYRWSSYPDYIGRKNFPSVTQREFILGFFGGTAEYKRSMLDWLQERKVEEIESLTLE